MTNLLLPRAATVVLALLPLQGWAAPTDAAPSAPSSEVTVRPPPPPSPSAPELKLGGGAYLWYYQPFLEGSKNNFSLYTAYLSVDAKLDSLAFHIEPRLRISKLRPYYPGNVWVQEVYASWSKPDLTVKVGKVYSRFGRFWDDSFYGNLLYFDGITLDPNYGASAEGKLGEGRRFNLEYDAQFFLVDGETNGSLAGRDTISLPNSRRRNEAVVRLAPGLRLADNASAGIGLSGQYFQADLDGVGPKDVWRFATDASVTVGPVTAFGEYLLQRGQSVTDFPIASTSTAPGRASARNDYFWAGVQAKLGRFAPRYNFSVARYHDVGVTEVMHQPGVTVTINNYVSILGELALWSRVTGQTNAPVDRSLNVVLIAHL